MWVPPETVRAYTTTLVRYTVHKMHSVDHIHYECLSVILQQYFILCHKYV